MPSLLSIQAFLHTSCLSTMTDTLKWEGLKKAKMTCTTVLQTSRHVTKLEIHICRGPSFPRWGNRAEFEWNNKWGPKEKPFHRSPMSHMGIKGAQTLSAGEYSPRRFSHVPYFIRRCATHEVPVYHLKMHLHFSSEISNRWFSGRGWLSTCG